MTLLSTYMTSLFDEFIMSELHYEKVAVAPARVKWVPILNPRACVIGVLPKPYIIKLIWGKQKTGSFFNWSTPDILVWPMLYWARCNKTFKEPIFLQFGVDPTILTYEFKTLFTKIVSVPFELGVAWPTLRMRTFQNWLPSHPNFHFSAFYGVGNYFLEDFVDEV